MSTTFLHGIETIESTDILPTINEVRSAVIGIVGTAPSGPVNVPTIIQSAADAAQFGSFAEHGLTSGYTIPYALSAIQEYGAGTVVAINVFEPTTTGPVSTNVTDEAVTYEDSAYALAHQNVSNVVVKSSDGSTTYTATTDYTVNATAGTIAKVAEGALAEISSVKVSYTYTAQGTIQNNVADVTNAQIIGSTDASGNRTGAQALLDSFSRFGFAPKILVAPGFSSASGVYTALLTLAEKLRAIVLIDMPAGLTVAEAIAARGTVGDVLLNTTSDRAMILYPHVKHYDAQTDSDQLMPLSATMAGLMAKTDRDYGYWYSPSNKELIGVTGLERSITSSYTDSSTEIQQLNEKGITSVLNAYGTGYRIYGNRLASFNATNNSGLATFLVSRRVCDMIAESLEQAMQQYVDRPLTAAIINDICLVGNSFLNTLTSRGALIGGKCYPSPTENTAQSLSSGHLVLVFEYNPPAPLERLTHRLVLTNAYYES